MLLGLLQHARELRRDDRAGTSRRVVWLAPLVVVGLVVVAMFAFVLALGGGSFGCLGTGGSAGPSPSRAAVAEIPPARLLIYQRAGRRFDIDWTFVASIGAQECGHGSCAGDNGSGCGGPMQIAFVPGSPCSPGAGPTEWDRFKTDGDGDGRTDVNDPADAIFTAARLLRFDKGAPPTGGSYAAYHEAACRYYGACADAVANYANEVMQRAVRYGFHGPGAPTPSDPRAAEPATGASQPVASSECSGDGLLVGSGKLGPVVKLRAPRRLAPLPASIVAPGFAPQECDARIVPDVIALARRYGVLVTACFGIHSLSGEHPLGAATDLVPADGDWNRTLRLAHDLGWQEGCAASGVAPACARPPFRFIGYNGFPNHGDPVGCLCSTPHLHLSWLTSASSGEPENQPRTTYFPPTWIDVFQTSGAGGQHG
ncbi:MAG TPA: hypothetical protein VN635_09385 [Conexibacter sp.]|nr:hypothetical protein [Conexibacter sp.]